MEDNFLKNPLAPGIDSFSECMANVYHEFVLPFGGAFLMLAFFYSGYLLIRANGKHGTEEKKQRAKKMLLHTVAGTCIILLGWLIAEKVLPYFC